MTPVAVLNRRLYDSLGSIGGSRPRFCWMKSTELFWYFRENALENFQRQCWADRIGGVWVMAQWQVPTGFDAQTGQNYPLTEENWYRMFRGTIPYPARGEYVAHPETQLAPGQEPTDELTANYIWALDKQMSSTFRGQLRGLKTDLDEHQNAFLENQHDMMLNEAPAFGNYAPGTRGGFLSFGGV